MVYSHRLLPLWAASGRYWLETNDVFIVNGRDKEKDALQTTALLPAVAAASVSGTLAPNWYFRSLSRSFRAAPRLTATTYRDT